MFWYCAQIFGPSLCANYGGIHIVLPLASQIMAERDRDVYRYIILSQTFYYQKITIYCQQDNDLDFSVIVIKKRKKIIILLNY